MEKANNILKFLPKVLSFNNPPYSPSWDKDVSSRYAGRFSGPIVSIIPKESRRRTSDTPQEPTSPKVSCLGQIKQRRSKNNKNKLINKEEVDEEEDTKRRRRRSRLPSKESNKNKKNKEEDKEERMSVGGNAPALGQMRKFSSSRSSLSNFDWTAQVAPDEVDRIAFSAPLVAGGLREMDLMPKKEINLWKRRTMEQPRPLSLGQPPRQSDS